MVGINIERIRQDFPAFKNWAYLDTAYVGLSPKFARDSYDEFLDEWMNLSFEKPATILGKWMEKSEETRVMVAEFLNAKTDEIAFTQCTGCGLNLPVNCIDFKKGDNVVTPDLECNPLVTSSLRRKGVQTRIVKSVNGKVELSDLEREIDDHTRVLQVSQVSYINGFRFNLKEVSDIAHEHNALVSVDSIQATGAIYTDVKREDVDFLSAGTYKYLIGPPGLGIFYTKSEHIENMFPDRTGWGNKIWNLKPYELPKSAKRFEYGTLNFGGIYAFHDSLSYLKKIGIKNIEKRVLELSSYLRSRLNDIGAEMFTPENTNSPIISVFVKNAQEIGEKLRKKRVKVTTRDWNDNGYFRVSVHFYNTREDIDVFIEELEMMVRDD